MREVNPFSPPPTHLPSAPTAPSPAPTTPPPLPQDVVLWTASGNTYQNLTDIEAGLRSGQIAMPASGKLEVSRQQLMSPAERMDFHDARSKQYLKTALVAGVGGFVGSMIFPPLLLVGGALAIWNGYQAYEEHSLAHSGSQTPAYEKTSEGRVSWQTCSNGTAQLMYQEVDRDSIWNVVPTYPFIYKAPVAATQLP